MRVRVVAVVGLVACGATERPPPPPPAPPPQRDLAVAEPPPKPPPDAGTERPSREVRVLGGLDRLDPYGGRSRQFDELGVAERYHWGPCVRDFVQAQPDDVRRALTAVFARYAVSCDAERRVVVAPPHAYRGKSFLAYRGTFAPGRAEVVLDITTCGAPATFDQVAIVYDRKQWTAGRQVAEQVDGCTTASVPDVRSLRRVLRDVVDARDAFVRIDGDDDVPITDDMKRDLRLMLDAIDVLSAR